MSDATSDGYARRSGPRDRTLRVGDSERDAVADILREHYLRGRLTSDEFQERLERCLAANTYAELDALVADFPAGEERRRPARGWSLRSWAFPFVPLVVVAIVASDGRLLWLAFPLVFFVVRSLLWRSRGFGAPGLWACDPRHTTRGPA
jgi:hypothetical protein